MSPPRAAVPEDGPTAAAFPFPAVELARGVERLRCVRRLPEPSEHVCECDARRGPEIERVGLVGQRHGLAPAVGVELEPCTCSYDADAAVAVAWAVMALGDVEPRFGIASPAEIDEHVGELRRLGDDVEHVSRVEQAGARPLEERCSALQLAAEPRDRRLDRVAGAPDRRHATELGVQGAAACELAGSPWEVAEHRGEPAEMGRYGGFGGDVCPRARRGAAGIEPRRGRPA